MSQESNVYGYIKFDRRFENSQTHNTQCVKNLPLEGDDRLLWQGMFNLSMRTDSNSGLIHFAAAYNGVEYEWDHWIAQFQKMLSKMHWDNATVHLETLLSGNHVFNWEYEELNTGNCSANVRCEWVRESVFA